MSYFKEYLKRNGIKILSESEKGYRIKAFWRNGKGPNVLVSRKNGRWYDFVTAESGDFDSLKKLVNGEELPETNKRNTDADDSYQEIDEMEKPEKTYNEDILKRLVFDHSYWKNRKIGEETIKFFKIGCAHSGALLNRIVSPIYRFDGKIHGFVGRDLLKSQNKTKYQRPKYKIKGDASKFIYPLHVKDKEGISPCLKEIEKRKSVFLVESTGDMMALWGKGYKNVLTTFGLNISSKLMACLNTFHNTKIILSLNGDDRGLLAILKNGIKLLNYFDPEDIYICIPEKGDMLDNIDVLDNVLDSKNQKLFMDEFTNIFDKIKRKQSKNFVIPKYLFAIYHKLKKEKK